MRWTIWVLMALLAGCAQPIAVNDCQVDQPGCSQFPPQGAINLLAKQIADELTHSLEEPVDGQVVAVATPVTLDGFSQSGNFALQLGDALLSALHQRGFTVVDVNGSDVLRITEQGNLLLSRDFMQLTPSLEVDLVAVTTLGYSTDSVQIFSRMLALGGNRIAATSQTSVNWRNLPSYFQPRSLVSLKQGKLYRHADLGQGEIASWEQ